MNKAILVMVLGILSPLAQPTLGETLSKPGACYSAQALDRFAAAYAAAYHIRQVYGPRVEKTVDPQQADRLMQEADAAVNQAIRDYGLDLPSFFMLEEAIFGFRGVDFGPDRDHYALGPEEIRHIVNLVQEKMGKEQ
jgi:AraC-like DNA-binding protein